MKQILCNEGQLDNKNKIIKCKITGKSCTAQRYCSKEHLWVNSDLCKECKNYKEM